MLWKDNLDAESIEAILGRSAVITGRRATLFKETVVKLNDYSTLQCITLAGSLRLCAVILNSLYDELHWKLCKMQQDKRRGRPSQ